MESISKNLVQAESGCVNNPIYILDSLQYLKHQKITAALLSTIRKRFQEKKNNL